MHTAAATLRHPSELDLGTGFPSAARTTLQAMSTTGAKPISNVALERLQETTKQGCTRYAAIRVGEIVNAYPQITLLNLVKLLRREAASAATR